MKNLFYAAFLVPLLGLMTFAMAATEAEPYSTDLLAGQNEKVGVVEVWDDGEYLHVTYKITEPGWIMTSTKLHVATDADDIPQNKNKNPQVGQFGWKVPDFASETEHQYIIPLGDIEGDGSPCDGLFIAAHATVWDTTSETTMYIVSGINTGVIEINGSPASANAVLANEPFTYGDCGSYKTEDTLNSMWDDGIDGDDSSLFAANPAADWIWNTLDPVNPINGDVVKFQETFDIPGLPVGGLLLITADNGYAAKLNGVDIGQAQLGPGFPGTLKEMVNGTPQTGDWGVASQGWQTVEDYLLTTLVSGENSLVITAANEYMNSDDSYLPNYDPSGGTPLQDPIPGNGPGVEPCLNPGAVIYKAGVNYYERSETAWADGDQFNEKKSWAMYFTYDPSCECTVQYPDNGNVYIGYEDWINGDFDYNDWGMYFSAIETYEGGCDEDALLTKVEMTFTAAIYDSGGNHLIHILRPIGGNSSVTVTRSIGYYGDETPAGTYPFTGDVDIVLFDTSKYDFPEKQIGETVTVEIVVGDPSSNEKGTPSAPRWDLDPFMANYDPYAVNTDIEEPFLGFAGEEWHIDTEQDVASTTGQDADLVGMTLPHVLVIPSTDWIPPLESTTITTPYGYFYDYYDNGSHATWYNEITDAGGLSW